MRLLLVLFLTIASIGASATNKTLDIGLFWNDEPREIVVQPGDGTYTLLGNGQEILQVKKETIVRLKVENGLIHLRTITADLGVFGEVEFKRNTWGSSLKIQRTDHDKKLHEYHDEFVIKPFSGKLRIINHVYIENYVSGVVESEAGSKEPKEYYKVQSVICRTYALNNRRRHEAEGFQLCDKVHCQVYHRRSKSNPDIILGTKETIGIVIVDSDINLITAAFYSNCGGFTCNSEDVWSSRLGYLRERLDPYCHAEPHAYWRKAVSKQEWINYLENKFRYPVADSAALKVALDYCPDIRYHTLNDSIAYVPFKTVRSDWKLKSAFFSIDQVQDSIVIEGRGYGHGVGLCQEGAMNMAKRGFTYDQILQYYYQNIHLVNLSVIDFFRSE
ncbi:MAG: SpoIID/LytB domain-containing protein [Salibacteraceae bacterium]|nr:SpoIID/LytB domain-containing protein [Salibacteraceae bacterium]